MIITGFLMFFLVCIYLYIDIFSNMNLEGKKTVLYFQVASNLSLFAAFLFGGWASRDLLVVEISSCRIAQVALFLHQSGSFLWK